MAGEFSFYIPPARETVKKEPLVYSISSTEPRNQLYFWPEYRYTARRKGQNAIYVAENGPYDLEKGWLWKWLAGKDAGYRELPPLKTPPPQLVQEFGSVTDLGEREVKLGNRVFRRVQLFECRDLR